MARSLEARVPLLLPGEQKLRGDQTKWIDPPAGALPARAPPAVGATEERGASGCRSTPGSADRSGREPASSSSLADWRPTVCSTPSLSSWREHLSRRRNWQSPLWGVLMFEQWRRRTADRAR